jgi:predicted acyl esterase
MPRDGTLGTAPPADTASDTYVYDPRDPVPSAGGAPLRPITTPSWTTTEPYGRPPAAAHMAASAMAKRM